MKITYAGQAGQPAMMKLERAEPKPKELATIDFPHCFSEQLAESVKNSAVASVRLRELLGIDQAPQ